ncbi:Exportin-5 [Mortierella sp. GBA30]|nr:Exportin-5 [Mortierella sp. GBA30]
MKPSRRFVPPLLELYSRYLAKDFEHRRRVDPIYRHFASVDFDSVAEFRTKAPQTFQKAVNVIHSGVPIVPLDAFLWVANRVAEALKTDFPKENAKDTIEFRSFDGTFTLMEVTISSLTSIICDETHPQSAQCPTAMDRVVGSLSAFTEMLKLNSTQLFRCLDKLFKSVEYTMLDESAHDVRELRRRAAITLVKFGRAIPNTLYPIYNEIEAAIQRLIGHGIISMGDKKTLLSFLLVVGFNSSISQERKAIFEKVVLPVALDLQSQELQDALSDPKKFMAFVGVIELSEASSKTLRPEELDQLLGTITQRRAKLSWSIDTLLTFMKETVDVNDTQKLELWSYCLESMLPNLLNTIRCLNAICDESLWNGFSPDLARILNMSTEEKEMMVTGKAQSSEVAAGVLSVTKMISDLKVWLSVLRDHSYKFLAQISVLGPVFYSIPSLQTILEQALFGHVDSLTNRQLRFLINTAVQPLVLNCPKDYMDSVLSHLLMLLFPYLDQRLQKDWRLASKEGLIMDEMEDPEDRDVSDEIVKEIMLRDLTRFVADFVFSILDFAKQKTAGQVHGQGEVQGSVHSSTAHKEITPLALFILSSESIAQSVIPLICRIITFKDTKACTRSAETALCVLKTLVQNYPGTKSIIGLFATVVLQAALEALHDPYHQEGQDKLILLITEVYVEVRAFDEAPKAVFQLAVGADTGRLEIFERELSHTTNRTKKHALVRNFLQGIIGVAKSEWFKQKAQGDKPGSVRTIAGNYERPSKSVLDSEHHEDIGEGLASLFDE